MSISQIPDADDPPPPQTQQSPETVPCQLKCQIESGLPVASSAAAAYGCIVADGSGAPELHHSSDPLCNKCPLTLSEFNFVPAHLHREHGSQ